MKTLEITEGPGGEPKHENIAFTKYLIRSLVEVCSMYPLISEHSLHMLLMLADGAHPISLIFKQAKNHNFATVSTAKLPAGVSAVAVVAYGVTVVGRRYVVIGSGVVVLILVAVAVGVVVVVCLVVVVSGTGARGVVPVTTGCVGKASGLRNVCRSVVRGSTL